MDHKKILNIIKTIIINLIILLLGAIVFLIIWASIQLNVQNKPYIDIFGYSFFATATGSMYPTIQEEDIVIVKIGEPVGENDIITYKKDNAIITHRIIEIENETIIAQGDNNNTPDDPIQKSAIIGKVTHIIKDVKVWKKVFSDIEVMIPIIITTILVIVLVAYKEKTGEKDD